ncbi:hypothetical protein [Diaphorobacter caeni]|uniref:hypothetical protein n=1 Tax=Diaphorobacter caeni TaxID=2784387 RepID=UPI00188F44C1|nr:hypothetical protein [Diaphorobacter caeni]MBF5007834.1 hypothetical protein [Diaphorobacter caeni]
MSQTPKQLAGAQRRSLKSLQKKIEVMSAEWADVDEFNLNELKRLADQCKEVAGNLVAE